MKIQTQSLFVCEWRRSVFCCTTYDLVATLMNKAKSWKTMMYVVCMNKKRSSDWQRQAMHKADIFLFIARDRRMEEKSHFYHHLIVNQWSNYEKIIYSVVGVIECIMLFLWAFHPMPASKYRRNVTLWLSWMWWTYQTYLGLEHSNCHHHCIPHSIYQQNMFLKHCLMTN